MKSSYLINLGLIILLVGLYWFNNHSNTPSSTDTKLTLIDSETVEHIIISQANRAEIILDKTAGQWQLTTPLTAHANPTRINLLLSLLLCIFVLAQALFLVLQRLYRRCCKQKAKRRSFKTLNF